MVQLLRLHHHPTTHQMDYRINTIHQPIHWKKLNWRKNNVKEQTINRN